MTPKRGPYAILGAAAFCLLSLLSWPLVTCGYAAASASGESFSQVEQRVEFLARVLDENKRNGLQMDSYLKWEYESRLAELASLVGPDGGQKDKAKLVELQSQANRLFPGREARLREIEVLVKLKNQGASRAIMEMMEEALPKTPELGLLVEKGVPHELILDIANVFHGYEASQAVRGEVVRRLSLYDYAQPVAARDATHLVSEILVHAKDGRLEKWADASRAESKREASAATLRDSTRALGGPLPEAQEKFLTGLKEVQKSGHTIDHASREKVRRMLERVNGLREGEMRESLLRSMMTSSAMKSPEGIRAWEKRMAQFEVLDRLPLETMDAAERGRVVRAFKRGNLVEYVGLRILVDQMPTREGSEAKRDLEEKLDKVFVSESLVLPRSGSEQERIWIAEEEKGFKESSNYEVRVFRNHILTEQRKLGLYESSRRGTSSRSFAPSLSPSISGVFSRRRLVDPLQEERNALEALTQWSHHTGAQLALNDLRSLIGSAGEGGRYSALREGSDGRASVALSQGNTSRDSSRVFSRRFSGSPVLSLETTTGLNSEGSRTSSRYSLKSDGSHGETEGLHKSSGQKRLSVIMPGDTGRVYRREESKTFDSDDKAVAEERASVKTPKTQEQVEASKAETLRKMGFAVTEGGRVRTLDAPGVLGAQSKAAQVLKAAKVKQHEPVRY